MANMAKCDITVKGDYRGLVADVIARSLEGRGWEIYVSAPGRLTGRWSDKRSLAKGKVKNAGAKSITA